MTRIQVWGLGALLSLLLAGCDRAETPAPAAPETATPAQAVAPTAPAAANVTAERLLNAGAEPGQWMTYGGAYEEQRYSRLTQINKENVKSLGLVWFADYDTNLQQTGSPLYVDGVIYVSTAWSKVYAFDAKTGKELWKFNPKVPGEWAVKVCCGLVNRGIAAWNGKIYVGTLDARLIAIDAKTGKEAWSTHTFDETKKTDALYRYSITMAPRVVKGKVIIGNSGGEFGVRGYVSAYDAETGALAWRFYTVPGNPAEPFENEQMKMAAATWGEGEWWKVGGGGTVWDSAVYDSVNDLVMFGTGNGTPWNQLARDPSGGDNLFLASIIAVKADTGEYAWHYQTTPADTWDYDATSPMLIANLNLDGQERRVVIQPCKNGFLYVLDAASGKLLAAKNFTEMNWADGVDMETGRPRVKPEARYKDTPFNLLPGVQGAHGWHANAYSPDTNLVYIPTQHAYFPMVSAIDTYKQSDVGYNLAIDFGAQVTYYRDKPDAPRTFEGYLQAWDPVAMKEVWHSESNQGPTGGALATATGLIFQGSGSGQEFRAFDAATGEKLWSTQAQTAVLAPPISFELEGQQYVAVSVGGAVQGGYYAPNYSRMLVFGLNGALQLPAITPYVPPQLNPPPATASAEVVAAGSGHYSQYCAACHGENGQTRGATFPNLMLSQMLHSQEGFDTVVLQGALSERGMASFAEALKPEDTAAIRAFIIARANEAKNNPAPAFGAPPAQEQQQEDGEEGAQQPHEER
ncbi:MAG: PQQ-dependent dehydrogenase, methanol/ethanol family [Gammaproteobacteria bacterium]|nr:MAG: PQQ-dependent dehydrogenase, methanol/ethanol family [Gammaproteobacteria bacterium]